MTQAELTNRANELQEQAAREREQGNEEDAKRLEETASRFRELRRVLYESPEPNRAKTLSALKDTVKTLEWATRPLPQKKKSFFQRLFGR